MAIKDFFTKKQTSAPIIFHGFPGTKISEDLKGNVEKDEIQLNSDLGEEHPFDFGITEGVYGRFGFVTGIVDKMVDFVWGAGFKVKSKNESDVKKVEDWLTEVNFSFHGRKWLRNALVNGTGFLELGGKTGDVPNMIKTLDSKRMFIKRDSKGIVEAYNLLKSSSLTKRIAKQTSDDVTTFEPDQVAQYSMVPIGDSPYGLGVIWPAIGFINALVQGENDMTVLLSRKANSPTVMSVGYRDGDELPTQSAVESFGNTLRTMNKFTEFAIGGNSKLEVLDYGNQGEKYLPTLDHYIQMMIFSFQIPAVLLGVAGVPEGLAQVQMDAFERRIKSIQDDIEKEIETKVFTRVLGEGSAHVEIVWGRPSQEQVNKRIAQLQLLLTNMFLNPTLKLELERELAKQFEFDIDLDEPAVAPPPVSPTPQEKVRAHSDTEKDYTIEGWLGFNYKTYLSQILGVIRDDKFKDTRAKNAQELAAGKLSSSQTVELKKQLSIGFKKGETTREIAKRIESNVKPGDLFKLDKGKKTDILAISGKKRSMNIARTEVTRVSNAGAVEAFREDGKDFYRWIAASNADAICSDLNGNIFEVGSGIVPPAHPGCRCRVIPVEEKE